MIVDDHRDGHIGLVVRDQLIVNHKSLKSKDLCKNFSRILPASPLWIRPLNSRENAIIAVTLAILRSYF